MTTTTLSGVLRRNEREASCRNCDVPVAARQGILRKARGGGYFVMCAPCMASGELASPKQVRYLNSLIQKRIEKGDTRVSITYKELEKLTRQQASALIDAIK